MYDRIGTLWLSVILAAFIFLVGCENSLDPLDEEAGQFSVYGFLSVSQGEHFLRVQELNDPIIEDSMRTIDATVTLENLDTGTSETLTDSMVAYEGITTHNFRSEQQIQPEAVYQVTVERPDGRASRATATMPELTELDVDPEGSIQCTESVLLNFRNVPEQRLIRPEIGLPRNTRWRWLSLEDPEVHPDGTITFEFDPSTLIRRLLPESVLRTVGGPEEYCRLLDAGLIRITYTHFGPDWPADSLLTDPTASAVENGLGVFGGLHRDTLLKSIDR